MDLKMYCFTLARKREAIAKTLLIMKFMVFFLLVTCLQVSATGFGQKVSINEKKASLKKIFKSINQQSGYKFFYEDELINKAGKIDINVKDMPVEDALKICFKALPFGFTISQNTIVVTPVVHHEEKIALNEPTLMPPTSFDVKGIVKDDQGKPLQGVSVVVKGEKGGYATNDKGVFTIKVATNSSKVLLFSYVGMESREIRVSSDTTLNVSLTPAFSQQQDVVVIGYGTQSKAKVTGSIATVKMDEVLGDRPVTSTANLLQGALPGLQVSIPTGQPGGPSPTLNVRGGTDFGANSSGTIVMNSSGPFILVDNVPFNGDLNLIDPNDIETVTLLKDGGAAAIYGARSAFGVLLITTKKGGKNQKPQFNYSNNFVVAKIAPLPQKATPLQYVQSYIDGGNPTTGMLNLRYLLQDYQDNPSKYPGGYTFVNGVYTQLAATDALAQSLGDAATQQMHNFSVSGGNDKTTYRLSFGLANENGIIVPDAHQDYSKRYNLRSFISTDVNNWLNFQLDAAYTNRKSAQPFYQVGVASDFFQQISNMSPLTVIDTVPGVGQVASPKYWIENTAPVISNPTDTRITGRATLKPVRGLRITGEYTIDRLNNTTETYDKYAQGVNAAGATVYLGTQGGVYTRGYSRTNYDAYNLFTDYNISIKHVHNISATAGINYENSHYETFSSKSGNLIDPNNPSLSTATSTTPSVSDNIQEYANAGFFGRLNYDYKSKYLFQTSGRYDGSSKFPDGNRWGFFPSVSVGWRMLEERFMKFLKPFVNELKITASSSTVGNQNIGLYAYQGVMASGYTNWLNAGSRVITVNQPSTLTSANFTWETVSNQNIRLDWGIMKNHLTGSFELYDRNTTGILTNSETTLPATLGTGAPLVNAGSMESKGFEVQVNWRNKIGKVNYYITVNVSDYQSYITKVSNPTNIVNNLYVGKRMGDIWGFVTDRLYTVDDFEPGTLKGDLTGGILKPGITKPFNTATGGAQNPNVGDIMYKDLDGNGIINVGAGTLASPGDRKIIGNSTPRYQFGINGGVSYMNFDFSFVLNGVAKQDQFVVNDMTFPNYWAGQSSLYAHELDYWTPNNPQAHFGRIYTTTGVPVGTGAPAANQNPQTRFLQNSAYLRVKNLTLRYSVPTALLKRVSVSKLQFFYSLEDPFIFDHLPRGVYPDITKAAASSTGSGGGQGYPFMYRSSVGLNLSF